MEIEQKKVILTGAASGIGKVLLSMLADLPIQIVAADINPIDICGINSGHSHDGTNCFSFCGDLSNLSEIDRLFEFALEHMGGVDIFIANAGFPYYEKLGVADWQHISSIYLLNTFSPIYSLQKLIDLNQGRDFRMVMMSSAMAFMAIPGYSLYASTKAALDRFAEGMRYELKNPRQLMLVYPIATRTAFFKTANTAAAAPMPFPSQKAETVAAAILNGIRKDCMTVSPSLTFSIFFMVSRYLPFLRYLYQAFEYRRFSKWLQSTKIDFPAE